MSQTTIAAVLSLVGTLAGTFGGILVSARLVYYRIEQLEKKVEKHNSVVERVYILENEIKAEKDLVTEKLKVVNHRIEDLEDSK